MSKELNSALVTLAATIKPHLTREGGDIKGSKELFQASLAGTELTVEMFDKVNDHLTNLTSAVTLAHGELAVDAFKENKDLARTALSIDLNKGMGINQTIKRTAEVPNFDKENPGTKTIYGQVTTRLDFVGTANKGEYKKTRAHVSALVEGINS